MWGSRFSCLLRPAMSSWPGSTHPRDGGASPACCCERISAGGRPCSGTHPLEITSTYSRVHSPDGGHLRWRVPALGRGLPGHPFHLAAPPLPAPVRRGRHLALGPRGGAPEHRPAASASRCARTCSEDGSDGAVCWWYDSHLANQLHTFVQRVSAAGAVLWPVGGVQVGDTTQQQMSPTLALDEGSQDVIVGLAVRQQRARPRWAWASSGSMPRARSSGARMGSRCPSWAGRSQIRLAVHALPGGSSVLACQEYDAGSQVNSAPSRPWGLNPNGLPMWLEQPIALTTTVSPKGHMDATVTPDSRLLAVWADQRDDAADVYLQNLNPDGSLGPRRRNARHPGHPQPARTVTRWP
jgi:hypothetical protein